jgi:hypothetical protein
MNEELKIKERGKLASCKVIHTSNLHYSFSIFYPQLFILNF